MAEINVWVWSIHHVVSRDMAASKESHRSFDIRFKIRTVEVAEETSKCNASHLFYLHALKSATKLFEMDCSMCPTILLSLVNNTVYLSYRLPSSLSAGSISPINGDMVASKNAIFLECFHIGRWGQHMLTL